jgi:DnaJ-class molecular chaperone
MYLSDKYLILIVCHYFRESTFAFNIGPDLYGLLGVSRVATDAAIKQGYLLKAKEFHPDRNIGNKEIEEKFKLINQAYTILSNPEQRQIFDVYGYDHVKYK